jgi:starvation-inducible outer membrane lipoprotein
LIRALTNMRKTSLSKTLFVVLVSFSLAACQGIPPSPTPQQAHLSRKPLQHQLSLHRQLR